MRGGRTLRFLRHTKRSHPQRGEHLARVHRAVSGAPDVRGNRSRLRRPRRRPSRRRRRSPSRAGLTVTATVTATGREGWGDALKGFLIVLVVLWHVIMKSYLQIDWQLGVPIPGAWGLFGDLIWPFLMPLFLLVSGYFAANAFARPWSA